MYLGNWYDLECIGVQLFLSLVLVLPSMSIWSVSDDGLEAQGNSAVEEAIGIVPNTGFDGLSFSCTNISNFPRRPGFPQFSGSRLSGRVKGQPVPHMVSQEHSTRVLL